MPKLVITIEERIQEVGEKTLVGYAVLKDFDSSYPEESVIPYLAPLLEQIIMRAVSLIHTEAGATVNREGQVDRLTSFESLMAEAAAKLDNQSTSH